MKKKIRVINDKHLIDKLMSDDDENNDNDNDNERDSKSVKENNKYMKNKIDYRNKTNDDVIKKKRIIIKKGEKRNKKDSKYNIEKENEDIILNINDNINNIKQEKYFRTNDCNDNKTSNLIIYNSRRKPKINTLEYVRRINNNIDSNKLITSLSCLNFKNNSMTDENNNNINNNNESESSNNMYFAKKNSRPKKQIKDFMKNNKLKIKIKKLRLNKEKNEKIIKKFKNFVELQKNIEENKKLEKINKSLNLKTIPLNKNTDKENYIKKAKGEFILSQNTSMSSSLNQQELYLSIYDAQRIYSLKDNNKLLIKNHSMIIDNDNNKIYNDNKINNINNIIKNLNEKNNNKRNKNNYKSQKNQELIKRQKLDKNVIQTIKNLIIRLNKFLVNCTNKNKDKKIDIPKNKTLINDYDYILKNLNKFLIQKQNSKNKNIHKSNKNNKQNIFIKKQQPSKDNFKKISMNDIKKLINRSHNNINNNEYKLDNSAFINNKNEVLNKNNIIKNINKNKNYNFNEEQLNKYKEIFSYVFIYLKLFIKKNVFNHIISYINSKYKYTSGFNHIIFVIKKRPFNYLRIIQQREYYQVILRQFYIPYIIRAFNNIKNYAFNLQKFSDAFNVIKQFYFFNFLKRMLYYIEIKENYINEKIEDDKIIEEEKDEQSESSKMENEKKIKKKSNNNLDNNRKHIINNEIFGEVKILTNTFNILTKTLAHSPKNYIFNLLKKYYLESKNRDKNNINIRNSENIKKEINNFEVKDENKISNYKDKIINSQKEDINVNNNLPNEEKKIDNNYKNKSKNEQKYNSNKDKQINLSNEDIKKKETNLFVPYKEKIKNNLNISNEHQNDIIEDKNISNNIYKNDFKKYEQNNKDKINNEKEKQNKINKKIKTDSKDILSQKEKNLPVKNVDLIKIKKRINNQKDNPINNNKIYNENDDLRDNDDEFEKNRKIMMNITNEINKKITDELTNEIIKELFKEEIENKCNLLSYKKNIKKQSNSSINGLSNKDNISVISHSPGRKYNKSNSSQNIINNNEAYPNLNNNIQEEDELNNSIFKKTIHEIKIEKELNYYEENIFPKLLKLIEDNINKNYLKIINNLKEPLKKNDEEVMNDLSNILSYDIIINNDIIKYKSKFYNKDIIKKEYIDKKLLIDFNNKIKNELFYDKYYYKLLNQCVYDTTNEIIKNKRMYGNIGEPLLWSMRNRKIEYKYNDTKIFQNLFTTNIIKELKKIFFSKIGDIIDNIENLNISQFSKERDLNFNENIREELKEENDIDKLDEQETIVKLMISKIIMSQLLNEVIEILEHIQNSRKDPERYNNKSIYACTNMPLLSFQNKIENEEEENSEDTINQ